VAEIQYSPRFQLPHLLERERENTLALSIYREGALVAPTSGTVTLYDTNGTSKASVSATIISQVPRAVFTTSHLSPLDYGEGYYIEWALAMPDGVTHTFANDAIICKRTLSPVVSDSDIYQRVSSLRTGDPGSISSATTYQDQLDSAWVTIQLRMIEKGNRPHLIISPSALRECHINLTLAIVFEDLASRSNEAYGERARAYREAYESAWKSVSWKQADQEGRPESKESRKGIRSTVWLSSRR